MNGLWVLTLESIQDAIRRRLVVVLAVVCILSVMVLDSCTGCVPKETHTSI